MSIVRIDKIFNLVIVLIVGMMGYLCGGIFEYHEHTTERDLLLFERDSIKGYSDHLTYNVDWNALKNIEVSSITSNCRKCNPKVVDVFLALSEKEKQRSKGKLVD